ncbi:DEAD/DEAH box helicase [Candidatus Woesearchaeota archaeon]|nr:DEAD/DEAH box helicase [Candidatus Woesearchaeota archaeon]
MAEFKLRLYQESILGTATSKNTLAVLPTGLGKTAIAAMLIKHRITLYPESKAVFLAPTKPLVQQHETTLKDFLENVTSFSGTISPEKRKELWEKNQVFASTPQGFENDVISNKISLKDVSVIIFDEAHRAVGDYSYVFLAKKYQETAKNPRILGLTASPGSDEETILDVCKNLQVEEIEYRSQEDLDVLPYVQDLDLEYVQVQLPEELKRVKMFLDKSYESKLKEATLLGYIKQGATYTKTNLLKMISELHGKVANGEKNFEVLKTISLLSEALKIQHAQDLIETQGVHPLIEYLEQLEKQALTSNTKAVKNLVKDVNFRSALIAAKSIKENHSHPKIDATKKIILEELEKKPDAKIIIFSQFRDTGIKIKEILDACYVKSELFTGQAKKKNAGLSQKNQKEMIERFKQNEFSCLIATSVGEEGLDIPEVELVLFYEPVPSAIRTVQRRGRTGRHKSGRVIVLVTKETRDESNRWVAHYKEKRMYRVLKNIKNKVSAMERKQTTIKEYEQKNVHMLADYREKNSAVMKTLMEMGANLELKSLQIGDYHLTENVVIEYKKIKDFVDSIIDGRLLSQAKELKQYYKPLIIVEGDEDIYTQRKIHPNAIRGMIYTLTTIMKIPVIFTKNPKETASYLLFIANKEQNPQEQDYQLHSVKPITDKEQQEYIVSSLPGIGMKLAPHLLEKFKTIKKIMNADEEELRSVELIGEKKAKKIQEIINKEYEEK